MERSAASVLLRGIPASSGKALGKVKVIKEIMPGSEEKMQEGDVLVSPFTSPLLTAAIMKASAIVTDEGGVMSHAAIIAREMGIPCVTGTKQATRMLHDGQQVTVDGGAGIVYG